MINEFDILIVGGGLIGSTLAYSLKDKPLRIGIIEAKINELKPTPTPHDTRALALSALSQGIYQALGLWPDIVAHTTPIKSIHVSNQGRFGFTHIRAKDLNVEAMGHVVNHAVLQNLLSAALQNCSQIEIIAPAQVVAVNLQDSGVSVNIEYAGEKRAVTSKLLVAADGTNSYLRQLLTMDTRVHDYKQTAIVAQIQLQNHHDFTAYERFIDDGILAFLPTGERQCVLVCALPNAKAAEINALSDHAFLQYLKKHFGYRLGRLSEVGKRQTFPLQLIYAQNQVQPRFVLLGNACHTMHPIAAQGFNLGLRDVAWLAQKLSDAHAQGLDIADYPTLLAYQQMRVGDQKRLINFTHNLVQLFGKDYLMIPLLRDLGLIGLEICTPIKHLFARYMMGYGGTLPDLGMGLAL